MEPNSQENDPELSNLQNEPTNQQNLSGNTNTPQIAPEVLAMLREQHQQFTEVNNRNLALQEELRQAQQARNTPPEQPVNFNYEEFVNNPAETLQRAIARQVAPVIEVAQSFRREQAYNRLKGQFLSNPQYSTIVTALGFHLDNAMQNVEPNYNNMLMVINSMVGQLAITNPGMFSQLSGDQTQNNNPPTPPVNNQQPVNNTEIIPPHLKPSAAPKPPTGDKKQNRRPLTENERRIMRESKMTEDQWYHYMESDAKMEIK